MAAGWPRKLAGLSHTETIQFADNTWWLQCAQTLGLDEIQLEGSSVCSSVGIIFEFIFTNV